MGDKHTQETIQELEMQIEEGKAG